MSYRSPRNARKSSQAFYRSQNENCSTPSAEERKEETSEEMMMDTSAQKAETETAERTFAQNGLFWGLVALGGVALGGAALGLYLFNKNCNEQSLQEEQFLREQQQREIAEQTSLFTRSTPHSFSDTPSIRNTQPAAKPQLAPYQKAALGWSQSIQELEREREAKREYYLEHPEALDEYYRTHSHGSSSAARYLRGAIYNQTASMNKRFNEGQRLLQEPSSGRRRFGTWEPPDL